MLGTCALICVIVLLFVLEAERETDRLTDELKSIREQNQQAEMRRIALFLAASPVVSQKPTTDFLPCIKVPTGY